MGFPSNIWFHDKLKDAIKLTLKKHRDQIPAIWNDKAGFVIPSITQDDIKKVLASITRGVTVNATGKETCVITNTSISLPVVIIDVL